MEGFHAWEWKIEKSWRPSDEKEESIHWVKAYVAKYWQTYIPRIIDIDM